MTDVEAAVLTPSGRHADVIDAALTIFAAQGYRATTMGDIADALGIRAPSLYNHVKSKQSMLQQIVLDAMARNLADQKAAYDSTRDVTERLRRMTDANVRFHARSRREAVVANRDIRYLDEPCRSKVYADRGVFEMRFRETIEAGVREGAFDVRSANLATLAIIEMGVGVARWFRESGEDSESAIAYDYGEYALRIVGGRQLR